MTHDDDQGLATVSDLASALDNDDFARVARHLQSRDVVYAIEGITHRGPETVVESHRNGSATARRIFDHVEFSHSVVWHKHHIVRVDFSDRLAADGTCSITTPFKSQLVSGGSGHSSVISP